MKSEEQELAAIACGKRSKEDQALWDKVAKELFIIANKKAIDFNSPTSFESIAEQSISAADAFMAERAKRMKGGV